MSTCAGVDARAVPFTADVVSANVNTLWAIASLIWSSAVSLLLAKR